VPFKDDTGHLENILLIDPKGKTRLLIDPSPEHVLSHRLDLQQHKTPETIFVARNYEDAATLHQVTNCPVILPDQPEKWEKTARQARRRHPKATILIALEAAPHPDDQNIADQLSATIVRPQHAATFSAYAARPDASVARLLETGTDHYNFDKIKSRSSYARLQNPDGKIRHVPVASIADAPPQGLSLKALRNELGQIATSDGGLKYQARTTFLRTIVP
jgi:hypothetical protein